MNATSLNPDLLKLLQSILDSDYHSCPKEDRVGSPVWTDCLSHGFTKQKVGGLFSSGRKQGLLSVQHDSDGDTCELTQAGMEAIMAAGLFKKGV